MAHDNLTSRTNAKLRYARIHLEELCDCNKYARGSDFERAHQESFFAHLFGAYAALLQELNDELGCGLPPTDVSLGKLRNSMKKTGSVNPKLTELYQLGQDRHGWLAQAKEMRDCVVHISGISLIFYEGGSDDGTTAFRNPNTFSELPGHYLSWLERWLNEMNRLVDKMRL